MSQSIANTTITTQPNTRPPHTEHRTDNPSSGNTGQNNNWDRYRNNTGSHNNNTNNSGRHRNGNSHSGAQNNNNNRQRNNATDHRAPGHHDPNKFKGNTDGMNGHIFGCTEDRSDRRQYLKTVAALQQFTSKFPNSADFQCLFKSTPTTPVIPEPALPPTEGRTEVQDLIFKEEIKQYVAGCSALRSNCVAIWKVIISQCTDIMKSKLDSIPAFETHEVARDCSWLLVTILKITLQFDNCQYAYNTMLDAYHKFFSCRQSNTQSVDDYRQALALLWSDIIEHHGGTIVFNLNLTASRDAKGKLISKETRTATAKQETLAMALICGADPTRYGSLLLDLANHYAAGRDLYPKDLLTAYSLLLEYKVPTNARPRQDHRSTDTINSNPQSSSNPRDSDPPGPPAPSAAAPNSTATTAPTTVTPTPSTTMRPPAGHTFAQAVQTPPNTVTIPAPDTSLTQWAATMAQHDHSIDPSWILLDSQSTF